MCVCVCVYVCAYHRYKESILCPIYFHYIDGAYTQVGVYNGIRMLTYNCILT